MTDAPTSGKAESQEPSMEDILASIRRILAEDSSAPPDDSTAATTAARPTAPAKQADPAVQARSEPTLPPRPQQLDGVFPEPEASLSPEPSRQPELSAFARDDVFVLSPEMRAAGHALVSPQAAVDSTDTLSQLARAILDRRDIAVTARDVTLEGMVREMLRPLLREWLDRNLPYLIERLVKKEIDLMMNRAERLED